MSCRPSRLHWLMDRLAAQPRLSVPGGKQDKHTTCEETIRIETVFAAEPRARPARAVDHPGRPRMPGCYLGRMLADFGCDRDSIGAIPVLRGGDGRSRCVRLV